MPLGKSYNFVLTLLCQSHVKRMMVHQYCKGSAKAVLLYFTTINKREKLGLINGQKSEICTKLNIQSVSFYGFSTWERNHKSWSGIN